MKDNPGDTDQVPQNTKVTLPRYTRLKRFMILITSLTALVPLAIMTAINYFQDTRAYKAESRFTISRIISNTVRTLNFVIGERRSALSLVITDHSYDNLANDENLDNILKRLNGAFDGGFVDLGLIDSNGVQRFYAGPYKDLKGENYGNQSSFHEVILRGIHVSEVFMGHRNFPHFVIAVKHDKPGGDFYVLRATLDMDLLHRQIYSLYLDSGTDAFIVNKKGILQTASAFHGDILDSTGIDIPPHSRTREIILEPMKRNGQWETLGYAHITDSPFVMIAQTRLQNPFQHWIYNRSDVMWILLFSVLMIFVIVFYRSNQMIQRLHRADVERAKVFHNAEYTNKMATLGRLAAGVAHEINNPLAIINEKAGLLRDIATFTKDFPKKDKILKQIESITQSVERCSRVTHRLLGFGRRIDARHEIIDMKHLMQEVVGFQKTEATHRNIQINYDFPDKLPNIVSDRGKLQQVFLNLFNNAIAAVGDGGQIDITLDHPNTTEVTVTITDNGSGIPEEDLKNIFEPFYSTKGESGTGLGLSITKELLEKLGGLMEVSSQVGKGTSFTVNLPVEKV